MMWKNKQGHRETNLERGVNDKFEEKKIKIKKNVKVTLGYSQVDTRR